MLLFFFVLGLAIGSFLNVLVYRIRVAETILGRSHCPHCKEKIHWYDNIPLISFILLKSRCRYCRKKISWQYPLVEFVTGILFAIIGAKYFMLEDLFSWWTTGYFLVLISAFVVIFVYDILYLEIPSIVLLSATGIAILANIFFDIYELHTFSLNNSLIFQGAIGALIAFIFFFSLAKFSKEKWMGMGDSYLVILLGFAIGWPKILMGLFFAFSIGAICGIILILLREKSLGSQIPFAPFLILGTLIAMFFYDSVLIWYFGLFN